MAISQEVIEGSATISNSEPISFVISTCGPESLLQNADDKSPKCRHASRALNFPLSRITIGFKLKVSGVASGGQGGRVPPRTKNGDKKGEKSC